MYYLVEILGPREDDGAVQVLRTIPHEASSDEEAVRTAAEVFDRAKVMGCHGFSLLNAAGHEMHLWHDEDAGDIVFHEANLELVKG